MRLTTACSMIAFLPVAPTNFIVDHFNDTDFCAVADQCMESHAEPYDFCDAVGHMLLCECVDC